MGILIINNIKKHEFRLSLITGMILHVVLIQFDPIGLKNIHVYLPMIYIPIAWSFVIVSISISIVKAYRRVNSIKENGDSSLL